MKTKIKIGILLLILLIPTVLAVIGTRSLVSKYGESGYMCEDYKYQIVIKPTTGYILEEILSQNWHFKSPIEGNKDDCTIQSDDRRVVCGGVVSGTRTLIFNVLNEARTDPYNNIFSNDQSTGSWATGLDSVTVKPNECKPDNDNDKYYGGTADNLCGCVNNQLDCDDRPNGADGIAGTADDGKNINPGATEIPGDGIDQDCDEKDALLPSIVSRILPDAVQQGVQFEVTLKSKYTSGESSLVIDERFNSDYFNCGSAPSNKGECHIVNGMGKVRWVITTPSSIDLKYNLVPKSNENCYNFKDVKGTYGKYQFAGKPESAILGDYKIGSNDCISCTPTGNEICGNDVDEDCDGYICPSCECFNKDVCEPGNTKRICDGCAYIDVSTVAESCNNIDDNCDGTVDGIKRTMYQSNQACLPSLCVSEIQTCTKGIWSGTYQSISCSNCCTESESAPGGNNCNDGINNDCDNECDYAGCTGYSHGDYDCPVNVN